MATFTKNKFSASTDGLGIKVAATAIDSADTIHAAVATGFDEVWLYAVNNQSAAIKLTICFGGVSDVDNTIEFTVDGEGGLKCIIPGLILTNSMIIKAFAATTNQIVVYGFVNNIS
jgi:hypothetical protein